MNNPVVVALFEACAARGFSVLRVNFRGVGRSHGTHEAGTKSEVFDAMAALDWLQSIHPSSEQGWVMGYSFGAYVAMDVLMRRPESFGFIAVAPPCGIYDFSFLAPCPAPGLFVVGTQDTLSKEEQVARLVRHLRNQNNIPIEMQTIAGTGHYFKDHIPQLTACVSAYLDRRTQELSAA